MLVACGVDKQTQFDGKTVVESIDGKLFVDSYSLIMNIGWESVYFFIT